MGVTASESVEDGAVDWLALTNVPWMGRESGVEGMFTRVDPAGGNPGTRGEKRAMEGKAYKIGASHGSGGSHATAVY